MKRLLSVLTLLCACTASAADRPNILYIALEDITPMMGCYGDTYAKTPNFDQLAAESVRYTQVVEGVGLVPFNFQFSTRLAAVFAEECGDFSGGTGVIWMSRIIQRRKSLL